MAQENNNIVDTIMDSSKKVLDTIVENTKKFTNDNPVVSETMEKGTEWYKNWLESQKKVYTKTTEQAATATETVKENTSKLNEFSENWMKTQMNWSKQMWDMNQDWFKNHGNTNANANPFAQWQNAMNGMNNMNQWNSWMNNLSNNNWMNQMQNMNPFSMDAYKQTTETMTNSFNQFYKMLNNNSGDWSKNFQNGTVQDAYKSMVNSGEAFAKFAEMWAPMFKSIQDKTFNMDMYKQAMNPEMYKDMMDKYFGFMPESSRQYMHNMTAMMNDGMKQMSQNGMNGFQQMRGMMGNTGFNPSDMFGNMMSGYNTFSTMMTEAAGPFNKMVTPNKYTKAMAEWSDIANRAMVYNIKNSELQYMVYAQGNKVMDALAENIAKKVQEGTEVKSMMGMYQEWLNISDKTFVSLFESDAYSKLMGEVGSMDMRLKKDIELQVEKSFSGLPIATRSELDELYKTIYDLKKQVRQLESMMEMGSEEETTATEAAPAKKATKKA